MIQLKAIDRVNPKDVNKVLRHSPKIKQVRKDFYLKKLMTNVHKLKTLLRQMAYQAHQEKQRTFDKSKDFNFYETERNFSQGDNELTLHEMQSPAGGKGKLKLLDVKLDREWNRQITQKLNTTVLPKAMKNHTTQ